LVMGMLIPVLLEMRKMNLVQKEELANSRNLSDQQKTVVSSVQTVPQNL
jgi:hypothetical protein